MMMMMMMMMMIPGADGDSFYEYLLKARATGQRVPMTVPMTAGGVDPFGYYLGLTWFNWGLFKLCLW